MKMHHLPLFGSLARDLRLSSEELIRLALDEAQALQRISLQQPADKQQRRRMLGAIGRIRAAGRDPLAIEERVYVGATQTLSFLKNEGLRPARLTPDDFLRELLGRARHLHRRPVAHA